MSMIHVIFAVLFAVLFVLETFVMFRKMPENLISEKQEENSKNDAILNDKISGISNQISELSKIYKESFGTDKNISELLYEIG